jgi:hypothetical protein
MLVCAVRQGAKVSKLGLLNMRIGRQPINQVHLACIIQQGYTAFYVKGYEITFSC